MVQLASEGVAQTRAAKLIVLDRDGVINQTGQTPRTQEMRRT
jgi:histidinol phosphatase-like enzyme